MDHVRVYAIFLSNHLAGKDRADRSTAVDPDHDDIIEVNLFALGQLVEGHCVASFDRDAELHILGAFEILVDQFREKEGSAMK